MKTVKAMIFLVQLTRYCEKCQRCKICQEREDGHFFLFIFLKKLKDTKLLLNGIYI